MDAYKDTLHTYLHRAHDALRWKLEGLDEYDLRRPLVATGTNLLGLVKHTAATNVGYFGFVFDRPFDEPLDWMFDEDAEDNLDMFATEQESSAEIIAFDDRCWHHVDATIAALDLDSPGRVPWWPGERGEVTLHTILVHCIAEVNRHCGHADIVRELIDGSAGFRPENDNLPPGDWQQAHRERLERIARDVSGR